MENLNAYDKFVGKTVTTTVTERELPDGEKRSTVTLNQDDLVLKEIRAQAALDGLKLRVWLPKSMGTMDHCTDRLNVRVDENNLITRFNIG